MGDYKISAEENGDYGNSLKKPDSRKRREKVASIDRFSFVLIFRSAHCFSSPEWSRDSALALPGD